MNLVRTLAFALLAAGLLAVFPGAAAADPPTCMEDPMLRARPGKTRNMMVLCDNVTSVSVVSAPRRATLTNLHVQWQTQIWWTSTADADSNLDDRIVLDVTGPGGTRRVTYLIDVIPLAVNTPPWCYPLDTGQRSDGRSQVTFELSVRCFDDELDNFTIDGTGPGTFPGGPWPVEVTGGGMAGPRWLYVTAGANGVETGTFHATDWLGATSADTQFTVRFGSALDERPTCLTSSPPVYMRPGRVRSFLVLCTDPDGDDFTPSVTLPPSLGDVTAFEVGEPGRGPWGLQRGVRVEYTPRSAFVGPDELGVTATGERGPGPEARIPLLSRAPDENAGISCGSFDGTVETGVAGEALVVCEDGDGDPITAEVSSPPAHGTTGVPRATADPHGNGVRLAVPYTSAPGYVGSDIFKLRAADPYGMSAIVPVLIAVTKPATWSAPPPVMFAPDVAARRQAAFEARVAKLLGTKRVKLLRQVGSAAIYGRGATLRNVASQKALGVACAKACKVTLAPTAKAGAHGRAAALRSSTVSLRAGTPRAVKLRLPAAVRKRLKGKGGKVTYRVAVRTGKAKARTGTVTLTLKG